MSVQTQASRMGASRPKAAILLSGPLMGPGFYEKNISRAIATAKAGSDFAVRGKGQYSGWMLTLSTDGFGNLMYEGLLDEKLAEPTLRRLRGDSRVAKVFAEESPICSLIHFQLCPKGQEVR